MAKSNPDWKKDNWSYSNNYKWSRDFPLCNGESQSPINIDTSIVKDIGYLKELATLYKPSKCHIINKNNTPTIFYDHGSYIKFEGVLYSLKKFTIHSPSMHTINGEHYDVELCLYHCANPTDCADRGGVAFSILMKSGHENSKANLFLSQFINQIPQGETDKEIDIPVSSKWNIKDVLPKNKRFFYYKGSLPHPPCKEIWNWIVFEESVVVGKTIYDTLKLNITYTDRLGNIRTPVKSLGKRNIYYQSKNEFTTNKEIELQKVKDEIKELEEKKKNIEQDKKTIVHETKNTNELLGKLYDGNTSTDDNSGEFNKHINSENGRWLENNMIYIKALLIFVIIIGLIIISVKITKILIIDDVVSDFSRGVINRANIRKQSKNIINSEQQGQGNQIQQQIQNNSNDIIGNKYVKNNTKTLNNKKLNNNNLNNNLNNNFNLNNLNNNLNNL